MTLPQDLTLAERREMMRQLRRAAGLTDDEKRLDVLADSFDGLIASAARLRAAAVSNEPACAFRPLEMR